MLPKFSTTSGHPNKLETFPGFDRELTLALLKEKLARYEAEYFDKQNISDVSLNEIRKQTTRYAYDTVSSHPDRFARLVERLPALLGSVLPDNFTNFKVLKTGNYLDLHKNVDILFRLDDSLIFGIDVTSNLSISSEVAMITDTARRASILDMTDEQYKQARGTIQNKFLNVVLPIDEKEFLLDFYKLSINSSLTFEQAYLILLKRFYIDKICKFITQLLTMGKTTDFRNIIHKIKEGKDLTSIFGVKNLEEMTTFKKYLVILIVNLYKDFYQNPKVLELHKLDF